MTNQELIEALEVAPTGVVAWVLGVTDKELHRRKSEGRYRSVARGKYNLRELLAVELKHQRETARPTSATVTKLGQERVRRAQAEKLELELEHRRGELLERDQVLTAVDEIASAYRMSLEGLSARLGSTVTKEVAHAIDVEISRTLERACARLAGLVPDPTPGDTGDEAAA